MTIAARRPPAIAPAFAASLAIHAALAVALFGLVATGRQGNGDVPAPLAVRLAGREKQLVMIGQGKKFELWDGAQWEQRNALWREEAALGSDALPPELQSLSL